MNSSRDITYGSIVPLIGGENLGIMESLDGKLPEWMLSYSPFASNDEHLVQYLRDKKNWKGEYTLLDEEPNKKVSQVDVVNTTCPCAGLSSLSRTASASSEMNDWMYKTTEYVLENIKPEVFWGENAPRLYSAAGRPVVERLHKIGLDHGYTLNLYQTGSQLHGIAQKRPRTFYFFTKGTSTAPLFRYIRRPMERVQDILTQESRPNDPMDRVINEKKNPYDNPWLRYCMYMTETNTIKEFFDHIEESVNCISMAEKISNNLREVAEWMESNDYDSKVANRARHMQSKLDEGKSYWGHGITVPKNGTPSFIGVQPQDMVNPFRDTYVTFRDGLRIMKHPDDFDMVVDSENGRPKDANHMCQNVPVTTARDMSDFVLEYLNGDLDTANSTFVKQSNQKMCVEETNVEYNTLDSFL